jgi:uridine kinase
LEDLLIKNGITAYIIQQDDYFEYPPKTNARMREQDISRVGPQEVRIDLINQTISSILSSRNPVMKPLVIFTEDRITTEEVNFAPFRVVILEGTYTTLADNIHCKVFIDRDLEDTREDRLKRNREKQDEYLENILRIEHEIISKHKALADIIITKQFTAARKK